MKTIRTLTSGRKPNREKTQVLGLKKSLERLECRMCCYLRPGNARFPRHKAWGKQLSRVQCHLPNQYMQGWVQRARRVERWSISQCLLEDPWPIKRQCWLLNFYFKGLLFWNFWSAYIYIYIHINIYIYVYTHMIVLRHKVRPQKASCVSCSQPTIGRHRDRGERERENLLGVL